MGEDRPGDTPDLQALRAALESGTPLQKLDAIEEISRTHKDRAVSLVPQLAALLTSEEYVPCTAREYEFSGHAEIGFEAMSAIRQIGTAPDLATMRRLLDDPRVFLLPEASYDQGAYIGDYGGTEAAPAGLAARLVEVMGTDGFVLTPVLARNAGREADVIAQPAQRAMRELAKIVGTAPPEQQAGFAAVVEVMGSFPDVITPNTTRGFDLRDLVAFCRKRMGA